MLTMASSMHLSLVKGTAQWSVKARLLVVPNVTWAMVIVGVDPDAANNEKLISWTKKYWESMRPYSAGGAYINFMMDKGADRVKASYGDNYQRLVQIKQKYDPDNFFRVNQNINPVFKDEPAMA